MTNPTFDACESYRDAILDEAVGELDLEQERALRAHADRCAGCGAARARLRKALLHARSLQVPEPAPEYWQSFVPRLKERIATSQGAISVEEVRARVAARRAASAPPTAAVASPALGGGGRGVLGVLALAATVVLVLALPLLLGGEAPGPAGAPVATPVTATTAAASIVEELAAIPMPDDELVSELPWAVTSDREAGLGSDLDDLVEELTPDEMDVLAAWLDEEMAG